MWQRYWELMCNGCGDKAGAFARTKAEAWIEAANVGWVTKGTRHYCSSCKHYSASELQHRRMTRETFSN